MTTVGPTTPAVERTAAIRAPAATASGTRQKHTMAYCCAVLEDQLGRRARDAGG